MSIYHNDICSKVEIKEFREKVVKFLDSEGIKPHKIKALRSYDGEIRLYKAEQLHSKRMKFTNTKGTDSIEYAHCVWKVNDYPKFTKLRII